MTRCPNGHFTSAADYCDICGAPLEVLAGQGAVTEGGAAGTSQPSGAVVGAAAGGEPCPSCGTPHGPDALFCETCGYDFTTGTMPRPLDPPDAASPSASRSGAAAVPGTAGGGAEAAGPQASGPPDAQPAQTSGPPDAQAAQTPGLPDAPGTPSIAPWVVEVWTDPGWYAESQSPDPMPAAGPPRTVVLTGRSALVGRPSTSRNIHPDVDCSEDTGVSRRHAQLTTDGTRFWVEDLESANGTFVGGSSGPLPTDPVPVGPKQELDADDRVYVGAWTRLVVRPATVDETG